MHWNTRNMILLVMGVLPNCEVVNTGCGGDCDTDNLCIHIPEGGSLHLCGFDDNGCPDDKSDCQVPRLELTCHSGNGLNGATPHEAIAYGQLMAELIRNGWEVVPYLKDYF